MAPGRPSRVARQRPTQKHRTLRRRHPHPPIAKAENGGTLTVLSPNVPNTFDATQVYHLDTTAIMKLVTRGLTQTKYEDGNPGLVPDMATDLGRPNADSPLGVHASRRTRLRGRVTGEAADVAYAIKRPQAE